MMPAAAALVAHHRRRDTTSLFSNSSFYLIFVLFQRRSIDEIQYSKIFSRRNEAARTFASITPDARSGRADRRAAQRPPIRQYGSEMHHSSTRAIELIPLSAFQLL